MKIRISNDNKLVFSDFMFFDFYELLNVAET